MKLRNFKKAIHRVGYYKYVQPRILNKIYGYDDCENIYYSCHKLKAVMDLKTGKFIEFIINRRNNN